MEIEDLGYNVATHGQKGFNGVAILAKRPIEVARGLPGDPDDEQARYIEAVIPTERGAVRVASIYLPNGNPAPGEKYAYKLAFMERLIQQRPAAADLRGAARADRRLQRDPGPAGRRPSRAWVQDALFLPATRAKFRELIALGLTDALRATSDDGGLYTFWDYQAGAWQRNNGIRIDHALLSPQAAGPARRGGRRQALARAGEAVGPHAGVGGAGDRIERDRRRAAIISRGLCCALGRRAGALSLARSPDAGSLAAGGSLAGNSLQALRQAWRRAAPFLPRRWFSWSSGTSGRAARLEPSGDRLFLIRRFVHLANGARWLDSAAPRGNRGDCRTAANLFIGRGETTAPPGGEQE